MGVGGGWVGVYAYMHVHVCIMEYVFRTNAHTLVHMISSSHCDGLLCRSAGVKQQSIC